MIWVLIGCDSRGVNLSAYVQSQPTHHNVNISVYVYSGAPLTRIIHDLKREARHIRGYNNGDSIVFILFGGICSITSRYCEPKTSADSRSKSTVYLNVSEASNIEQSVISNIREFDEYCDRRGYTFIPTTILPVNFQDHQEWLAEKKRLSSQTFTDATIEEQQIQLETIINHINEFIIDRSSESDKKFINLARRIIQENKFKAGRTKRKPKVTRKFLYTNLYDGVHPDNDLKLELFQAIVNTIKEISKHH